MPQRAQITSAVQIHVDQQPARFRYLREEPVAKKPHIGPNPIEHRCQYRAIQNPKRMIGDNDDRARCRYPLKIVLTRAKGYCQFVQEAFGQRPAGPRANGRAELVRLAEAQQASRQRSRRNGNIQKRVEDCTERRRWHRVHSSQSAKSADIGLQDERRFRPHQLTRNLQRLGDEPQNLLVDCLPAGSCQEKELHDTRVVAHDKRRRNATADAANHNPCAPSARPDS